MAPLEQEDTAEGYHRYLEAKRLRQVARQAALEASAADDQAQILEEAENDLTSKSERKRLRAAAKASAAIEQADDGDDDENDCRSKSERKRLRQEAKAAALEASAAIEQADDDENDCSSKSERKRLRQAAKPVALESSRGPTVVADVLEGRPARKEVSSVEAGVIKPDWSQHQSKGAENPAIIRSAEEIAERSKKRKERKKQEREGKKTRADSMTVFVSGIHCDESAIRDHFSSCGKIDSIKVLMDKEGKPRGLAYISYETEDGATAALKLNDTEHSKRVLTVHLSKPKLKDNSDFEVFVKHFPRDEPDDVMQKMFAKCGPIDKLKIPRWDDGAAKGMAFIVFKDFRSVNKALALDGRKMGEKWIEVKKSAKTKDGQSDTAGKDAGGKVGKKGKGKSKGAKSGKAGKGKSKGGGQMKE